LPTNVTFPQPGAKKVNYICMYYRWNNQWDNSQGLHSDGIIEIINVLLKQYWEYNISNIPCELWYIFDVAAQKLLETCSKPDHTTYS
jgi:hypothetical protein